MDFYDSLTAHIVDHIPPAALDVDGNVTGADRDMARAAAVAWADVVGMTADDGSYPTRITIAFGTESILSIALHDDGGSAHYDVRIVADTGLDGDDHLATVSWCASGPMVDVSGWKKVLIGTGA